MLTQESSGGAQNRGLLPLWLQEAEGSGLVQNRRQEDGRRVPRAVHILELSIYSGEKKSVAVFVYARVGFAHMSDAHITCVRLGVVVYYSTDWSWTVIRTDWNF